MIQSVPFSSSRAALRRLREEVAELVPASSASAPSAASVDARGPRAGDAPVHKLVETRSDLFFSVVGGGGRRREEDRGRGRRHVFVAAARSLFLPSVDSRPARRAPPRGVPAAHARGHEVGRRPRPVRGPPGHERRERPVPVQARRLGARGVASARAAAARQPAPHFQRVRLDEADEQPLLREQTGPVSGDEVAERVVGGDAEEGVGDVDPKKRKVFFLEFEILKNRVFPPPPKKKEREKSSPWDLRAPHAVLLFFFLLLSLPRSSCSLPSRRERAEEGLDVHGPGLSRDLRRPEHVVEDRERRPQRRGDLSRGPRCRQGRGVRPPGRLGRRRRGRRGGGGEGRPLAAAVVLASSASARSASSAASKSASSAGGSLEAAASVRTTEWSTDASAASKSSPQSLFMTLEQKRKRGRSELWERSESEKGSPGRGRRPLLLGPSLPPPPPSPPSSPLSTSFQLRRNSSETDPERWMPPTDALTESRGRASSSGSSHLLLSPLSFFAPSSRTHCGGLVQPQRCACARKTSGTRRERWRSPSREQRAASSAAKRRAPLSQPLSPSSAPPPPSSLGKSSRSLPSSQFLKAWESSLAYCSGTASAICFFF